MNNAACRTGTCGIGKMMLENAEKDDGQSRGPAMGIAEHLKKSIQRSERRRRTQSEIRG